MTDLIKKLYGTQLITYKTVIKLLFILNNNLRNKEASEKK